MQNKLTFLSRKGGTRVFENDHDRLVDDIVNAISSVSMTRYTTSDKPRVDDLEQLLGEQITEGQRDEALKIFHIRNGDGEKIRSIDPEPALSPSTDSTGDQNETD